jgi:GT2 family glycosyltransferase
MSVVIICHNEKQYLARTIESFLKRFPAGGEMIIVDDHSTDGSFDSLPNGNGRYRNVSVVRSPIRLGVSGSRNFGAAHARGEILIFSDGHVEVPEGWANAIMQALSSPGVGAVVPAISVLDDPDSAQGYGMRFLTEDLDVEWLGKEREEPYSVPLMCGCFMAIHRHVFQELGGFDPGMTLYGSEDLELSLHLWLRGYECRVVPAVTVAHRFFDSFRYEVNWEPLHNRLRMGIVHFGANRCLRFLSKNQGDYHIDAAWQRLTSSDVWVRRANIQNRRRFDDDWYFKRFPAVTNGE